MKKKFTVCGNCQARPIGKILSNNNTFSSQYEFIPFPKPIYKLTKDDLSGIKSFIKKMDLFLFQKISNAFGDEYSSEALKSYTKPSCLHISYPSIYFTGYTPEIAYLRKSGAKANRYSSYHDTTLLNFFLDDPSTAIDKYEKAMLDPNFISEKEMLANANSSLYELRKREEHLDIKISDFIEENWLNELLFFSINHPSRKLLNEVAKRILKFIDIEDRKVLGDYEYLNDSIVPIHQSIKNRLAIAVKREIKIAGNNQSLREFAEKHIENYKEIKKETLIDNLKLLSRYRPLK